MVKRENSLLEYFKQYLCNKGILSKAIVKLLHNKISSFHLLHTFSSPAPFPTGPLTGLILDAEFFNAL